MTRFLIAPFAKRTTLPGLAYDIYRRMTDISKHRFFSCTGLFQKQVRAAYRGGRCEVFHHSARAT